MCLAIVFEVAKWPACPQNVTWLVDAMGRAVARSAAVGAVSLQIIARTASVRMYYIIDNDNVTMTRPVVPDRQ